MFKGKVDGMGVIRSAATEMAFASSKMELGEFGSILDLGCVAGVVGSAN